MGHITQDHLQQSTIAIPDNKDIADKFDERVSPIFEQIVKLQEEISNLTKQRDELLPLLMNGQVSVNSDLSNFNYYVIIDGFRFMIYERKYYSGCHNGNAT